MLTSGSCRGGEGTGGGASVTGAGGAGLRAVLPSSSVREALQHLFYILGSVKDIIWVVCLEGVLFCIV